MAFKTEEEIKEFLENLGTEYRFSCFKENDKEGCHLLGDYLEACKKDYEGAAKVFKSNCDDNKHPKSCFKYGNFCYLGKGIEPNTMTAYNYYKTACDLNFGSACLHIGVLLTNPEDNPDKKTIKLDYVTGLKNLEKACDSGIATACFRASGLYITGAEGIPKNITKASELSLTACNGGDIYACMNLSRMYKNGDGVELSKEKANIFKEKAREIRDDYRRKPPIGLQQYI